MGRDPATNTARKCSCPVQHGKNEARQRTPQQQLLAEINRQLYAYVQENNLRAAVERLVNDLAPSPEAPPPPPKKREAAAGEILALLLAFFADGQRWLKGQFKDHRGNRCLMGALQYVATEHSIDPQSMKNAERCLCRALPSRHFSLSAFNDSRSSYDEVRALILKARELAALPETGPLSRRQKRRPPQPRSRQWKAPVISEGNPLTEPVCADLVKVEAAAAIKQRLLAEIELERVARRAAGDPRSTYILCPEPTSNYRVTKVIPPAVDTPKNQSIPSPACVSLTG